MTVMELPEGVRRVVRTTNILERLNREVGRRTNVVDAFPNDGSVRRLYCSPAVVETEARMPRLMRVARQQAGAEEGSVGDSRLRINTPLRT